MRKLVYVTEIYKQALQQKYYVYPFASSIHFSSTSFYPPQPTSEYYIEYRKLGGGWGCCY
jgi:hypothetical protein